MALLLCGANVVQVPKPKIANNLFFSLLAICLAVRTGLEPATPCVTGTYSNQTELPNRFRLGRQKYKNYDTTNKMCFFYEERRQKTDVRIESLNL